MISIERDGVTSPRKTRWASAPERTSVRYSESETQSELASAKNESIKLFDGRIYDSSTKIQPGSDSRESAEELVEKIFRGKDVGMVAIGGIESTEGLEDFLYLRDRDIGNVPNDWHERVATMIEIPSHYAIRDSRLNHSLTFAVVGVGFKINDPSIRDVVGYSKENPHRYIPTEDTIQAIKSAGGLAGLSPQRSDCVFSPEFVEYLLLNKHLPFDFIETRVREGEDARVFNVFEQYMREKGIYETAGSGSHVTEQGRTPIFVPRDRNGNFVDTSDLENMIQEVESNEGFLYHQ